MFAALNRYLKERILGRLVHTYDEIKVVHGPLTCRDRFELRDKKGVMKLFHDRVCQDQHNVDKFFHEYDADEVEALFQVFAESIEHIAQSQPHDFGVILEMRDGSMKSHKSFYVEASGGEHFLFCRDESSAHLSSSTKVTYFPLEEVEAIGDVLADVWSRMNAASE